MEQKKITQKDYIVDGKEFEPFIRESDVLLRNDEYIVIHLDGVHFTSGFFRNFPKEKKKKVFDCLVNATKTMCNYFKSSRVAYVYGDEVSIILQGDLVKENYNNRIQKLCSIVSGFLSVKLIEELNKINDAAFSEFINNCFFAAKTYNIPFHLVNDYLKWRLVGCKKLIFDKKLDFNKCESWEQYGAIITYDNNVWVSENIDFRQFKFQKSPQSEYFRINKS